MPAFSPEQQHRLETALSQAGVDYTIETYKGARHGFAVTGHSSTTAIHPSAIGSGCCTCFGRRFRPG